MPKTHIISIINQKGGVAKTTTALHLAYGLAAKGYSILLFDLDPQKNLSSNLSITRKGGNVNDLFMGNKKISDLISRTNTSLIDILLGNEKLNKLDLFLNADKANYLILKKRFEEIHDYDLVIIDNPPNLNIGTVNALIASDHYIVPLKASKFSLDGLKTILELQKSIKKNFNHNLNNLGLLFVMFNKRTTIAKTILSKTVNFPVFNAKIPLSVKIDEALLLKTNIFIYAKRSNVAVAYLEFVNEVEKKLFKS